MFLKLSRYYWKQIGGFGILLEASPDTIAFFHNEVFVLEVFNTKLETVNFNILKVEVFHHFSLWTDVA